VHPIAPLLLLVSLSFPASYGLPDSTPSYTPCLYLCLLSQHHSLPPEYGGNKVLQNVGALPQHCTVSECRTPGLVHAKTFSLNSADRCLWLSALETPPNHKKVHDTLLSFCISASSIVILSNKNGMLKFILLPLDVGCTQRGMHQVSSLHSKYSNKKICTPGTYLCSSYKYVNISHVSCYVTSCIIYSKCNIINMYVVY